MVLPYDWTASYLGNDIRKRMGAVFGDEGGRSDGFHGGF